MVSVKLQLLVLILECMADILCMKVAEKDIEANYKMTSTKSCLTKKDPFLLLSQVTVSHCVLECGRRSGCLAVNYRRRSHTCELLPTDMNEFVEENNHTTGPCTFIKKSDMNVNISSSTCRCNTGETCDLENQLCTKTVCPILPLTYGTVYGNMKTVGSWVEFVCDEGYVEIIGQTNTSCQPSGNWTYYPRCIRDCGNPESVTGTGIIYTTTTENSTVVYMCLTGYAYSITDGDPVRVCGSDGYWTGILPACIRDCGVPASGTYTSVTYTTTTVLSTVAYACHTGYIRRSGDLERVCASSGNWDGIVPTCAIDCGNPETVTDADASYTTTFETSRVVYVCKTGYTLTSGNLERVCGSDGNWNYMLPTCTQAVDCGQPTAHDFATIDSGATTEGTTRTYSCENNYRLAIDTIEITTTCEYNEVWTATAFSCILDYRYMGCYKNDQVDRILTYSKMAVGELTPEFCVNHCFIMGYQYAGPEFHDQCWCGIILAHTEIVAEEECHAECDGDRYSTCGGVYLVSLFSKNTDPTYLGCYVDNWQYRILSASYRSSWTGMTTDDCLSSCSGHKYACTEFGNECACGDTVRAIEKKPDNECNKPCAGDSSKFCGASNRASLYIIDG